MLSNLPVELRWNVPLALDSPLLEKGRRSFPLPPVLFPVSPHVSPFPPYRGLSPISHSSEEKLVSSVLPSPAHRRFFPLFLVFFFLTRHYLPFLPEFLLSPPGIFNTGSLFLFFPLFALGTPLIFFFLVMPERHPLPKPPFPNALDRPPSFQLPFKFPLLRFCPPGSPLEMRRRSRSSLFPR